MKTEGKIRLYSILYRVSFLTASMSTFGVLLFKETLSRTEVVIAGIASIMTIIAFRRRDAVRFKNVTVAE